MANQLKANPFVLDTAGATVLWPSKIHVYNVHFAGYAVATDEAVLSDQLGNEVARLRGATDFSVVSLGQDLGFVNGLVFTSLTVGSTGKLFVYFR